MSPDTKKSAHTVLYYIWWFFIGILLSGNASASVVIHATRIIYPGASREAVVRLENKGTKPSLVQAWIDNGQQDIAVEQQASPFVVIPPVFRIEPGNGQTVRITYTGETTLPEEQESIFWLNTLDIPPKPVTTKSQANLLQVAINSRIKVFYRPRLLDEKDARRAAENLEWQMKGREASVKNNSPYFVSLVGIKDMAEKRIADAKMLPPGGSLTIALTRQPTAGEKLKYYYIDDFGAHVGVDISP